MMSHIIDEDGYTTQAVITGKLERDRLGYSNYVLVGGVYVKNWVFDELAKFNPGQQVRVTVEAIK